MAPKKKGKKKGQVGDWSDEDNAAEPPPEAPGESLPSDAPPAGVAPPAKKGKKGKKGKGKGKAGDDWGSDDDMPAAAKLPAAESDEEAAPQMPPRSNTRKQPPASSVFAMLDDENDGGNGDGEPDSGTAEDAEADDRAEAPASSGAPAAAVISDIINQAGPPVVAEVLEVTAHPSADRLRVCTLDIGADEPIRVVTNAADATAGRRVFVALAYVIAGNAQLPGSVTPGSGIKIEVAAVRGVQSRGMLCSPADLGWDASVNKELAAVPGSLSVGDASPAERPMELTNGHAKRGGKKKKKISAFTLPEDPEAGDDVAHKPPPALEPAVDAVDGDEDGDAALAAALTNGIKKKSKKGKRAAFVLPDDEPEGDADEASAPPATDSAPPEEMAAAAAVADSAPAIAGEEDRPPSAGREQPVDGVPAFGKKKKSKKAADVADAFAALELDADGVAAEPMGDSSPEAPKPMKKSKGKGKAIADADSLWAALDVEGGQAPAADGAETASEFLQEPVTAPEPSETSAPQQDAVASQAVAQPKTTDEEEIDALLAQLDAPKAPEKTEKVGKKKKKGKAAAKPADDEDLDALLAELDGPRAQPTAPADGGAATADTGTAADGAAGAEELPAAIEALDSKPEAHGGKKKKKKGKGAAAKAVEEDLDALLAELDSKPAPTAAPGPAEAAPAAAQPAAEVAAALEAAPDGAAQVDAAAADGDGADGEAEDGAEEGEATAGMSAAAKKKAKKKAKEKEKKADGGAKAPKVSAAVRKMQEAQEARLRAEAERRAAEEERIRLEEEQRLAEERAAAEKAAREEQRREARAAARAQAKKEGRLLTGKAKKEAERMAAFRAQLLAKADVDLPGKDGEAEAPVKKKVVYGRKKGPRRGPQPSVSDAQSEAPSALESVQDQDISEVPEAPLEPKTPPAAPPGPPEPTPEPIEEEGEESDGADWDALDLDEITLPGQKSAKELAAEKACANASAAEAAAAAAAEAAAQAAAEAAAARKAEEEATHEMAAAQEEDDEEDEDDEDEEGSEDESGSAEVSGSGSESESESESDYSSSYESETDSEEARERRIADARAARDERVRKAREAGNRDELRSPICCILGHVDTGKTKILDNVRRTNVQDGEAGGITQQIGATYVPGDNLRQRTQRLEKREDFSLKLPGLLIIDTPGHESFTNLRSRGSSLCDIAVLVVDIMHGLEQQTIESINLLKQRRTPFIIALNKVDRMFDWATLKDAPIQESLAQQKEYVRAEFERRMQQAVLALNEQGLNVALYWSNPDPRKYVNIVPTSAITGEGIPDLLQLLVELTQTRLGDRLIAISELQCTVLEVKVIEGLGTTMDVVLINGVLHEGDTVVVCGLSGPVVTPIRSLLTPHPMKELRVKGSYLHHKEIKAAQGVKIAAQGLESAVAGTQMFVVGTGDDEELLKEEVMADMQDIFSSVDRGGEGVCVQASTLGSLEALLEFLKSPAVRIPVSGINIGPVHKRDVMRASVMLEKGARKFACILAFDVPVTREARELAESMGVRIFSADIIYHLFDQFTAYLKQVKEDEQAAARLEAVFPCILKIIPTCIFNKKDPIVLGVDVIEGIAKVGTPITVPSQGGMDLGRIASMELNHKAVDTARRGDSVAMKLDPTNTTEGSRLYGRHFDFKDELVSRISRKSIDLLKEHFRDDMTKDDWRLVVKLKAMFDIS